ncbi:zinc finger protein 2 homolog isoform X2 [Aricia agestis]|uniref:zinc finger protein 2 homolog isoform X2 n=1 Tax=Aricia agestis TaxID=91739 RepID=UPI001C204CBF|nr:zinc finger protein 2 homolog isoform X2 [Aricia agestis]
MEPKTIEWRPGPAVCRCCLAEGCYKDISTEYFWMGKREVYAEMLSETLDLSIAYSTSGGPNSNSRLICEQCISKLRDATEFKRQVQECERTFIQWLDPGNSVADATATEVKLEQVKKEKNHNSDEDDDFNDQPDFGDDDGYDDLDDDVPLTKYASKTPKKEPVDLQDLLDNVKPTTKRKSTTTKDKSTAKKAKVSKEKATSSKPKPEKKKKGVDTELSTTNQQPSRRIVPLFQVAYDRTLCKPLGTVTNLKKLVKNLPNPSVSRDSPPRWSPPIPPETETSPDFDTVANSTGFDKHEDKYKCVYRQNALTVFEFSTACPFIYGNNNFKCYVCSEPFLDASLLRRHMAEESHGFASIKRLLKNVRQNILKIDISELSCKICSLRPENFMDLKLHLKNDHKKEIDPDLNDNMIPFKLDGDGSTYKCSMCDETFIKFRILVIHMRVHFSNYSCEVCGSGFMTLRLLRKHLEVHETGTFQCDKCNKVFNTRYKLSLHVRGVHLKLYPRRCPICPERFNSNYSRAIHLQDVHNQTTRVHKCETCGRAFNLKYHLICHTRSVHLQERNHQCKVCLQRFFNKETLKRHMIIHTGEKNYKCELCGLTFLRRKNLRDHLKLHEI